ncbi:Rv3654c family TadE-like protein, partial [Nocardioides sp.]|uniref:Rv3654c family TadE-like protein n=1 Tax=Nocardioides sp. TaxID=35761 RepID=UPI002C86B02E
ADLAALAGAAAAEQGGDPCVAAGDIAQANRGALTDCRVDSVDVLVTVAVDLPGGVEVLDEVSARARAGPS